MNTYDPKPIPTSGVVVPNELLELVERLSESNHDHWAVQRIAEGWTLGPKRDDESKSHPDLVPYGDLAESEREYDRTSVLETLKAIIALGYELRKST